MLQKKHPDYLVRKIEELAKVIGYVLGFKENEEHHEIITLTDETFNELFEGDIPLHSATDFTAWLEEVGLSEQDLINLSDIFYERAEAIDTTKGAEEALPVYQQALTCMNYTLAQKKVFPFHWASRMEYLKNKTLNN